jgi:hypothetical protein
MDVNKLKARAKELAADLRDIVVAVPDIATAFVTELTKKEEK